MRLLRLCTQHKGLLLLWALTVSLSAPQAAASQDTRALLQASTLLPQAVGAVLCGQDPTVGWIRLPRSLNAEPALSRSGFNHVRTHTSFCGPSLVQCSISFQDALGRGLHRSCDIAYRRDDSGSITVLQVRAEPFTPLVPACETYLVPGDRISLGKMHGMRFAELLTFARENAMVLTPGARDTTLRLYHVLAFAMDRLQPGDQWFLVSGENQGFSWNDKGWSVSGISVQCPLNAAPEVVFRAYYAPSTASPLGHSLLHAGTFSNWYTPPLPLGPSEQVPTSPAVRALKARFTSKAFPPEP